MNSPNVAPRWRRWNALLADYVVIGAIGLLIAKLFYQPLMAAGDFARLVGLAIVLAYYGWFNSWLGGGRSPGKRLLGLRVVKTDGGLLSPGAAALRGFVLSVPLLLNGLSLKGDVSPVALAGLSSLVFGVFLSSLYLFACNRQGRLLHDFAASSMVVVSGGLPVTCVEPGWNGPNRACSSFCS